MSNSYRPYNSQNFPEEANSGVSHEEKEILEMIIQAISGEIFAAKFYKNLRDMLIAEDDRNIVHGVMLDEIKHRKLFGEVYERIAGSKPDPEAVATAPQYESETPNGTLPAIFAERIKDELHDAEFYVRIYTALSTLELRDVLYEIITDEQRHAQFMNYLFAKYNK